METNGTSWTGVTNQMMNSWTEMGTQTWKNWMNLMGTMAPKSEPTTGFEAIAQRYSENQQLLFRLLRLSFTTWQEMMPKVTAGESWQEAMQNYTAQIRSQLDEFSTGATKTTQDVNELWQLYLKETQKFSQLWLNAIGSSVAPLSQAAVSGSTEPWIELNNLYWNLLYEESFGSLMQSPLLGPTREFNGKQLRAFDAWAKLYRAGLDYQVVLADVQVRSLEALMQDLVARAEKGDAIKDWRQFQQVWGVIADDVFEKAFCDEENLKVRGRYLNALNTYRIHQQELMELWMKALNIPSRSEIDELHKTVYELRKELKQLRKTVAQYESKMGAATEPVPETPTEQKPASTPADEKSVPKSRRSPKPDTP